MRRVIYGVIGLLLGSLLAWAGLFGWAAANLNPSDSLWDRNPQAANGFFALWLILAVSGGALGGWVGRKK